MTSTKLIKIKRRALKRLLARMLRRATSQPFNGETAFDFSLVMESLKHRSVIIKLVYKGISK